MLKKDKFFIVLIFASHNKYIMKGKIVWLFVLMMNLSFSQNIMVDNESKVSWSSEREIDWGDFKSKLAPSKFSNAKTSYKIEIIPENVLVDENDRIKDYEKLTVVANFFKNESWCGSKDENLLIHERLHFDIAEFVARKIRKRFSELKRKKESRFKVYSSEYSKLWNEGRELQRKYDIETSHGINLVKNKEWVLMINSQISSLKEYELN
jgi:hypothetical protein